MIKKVLQTMAAFSLFAGTAYANNSFLPYEAESEKLQSSWETHSTKVLSKLSASAKKLADSGNLPAILISKTSKLNFPTPKLNIKYTDKILAYAECEEERITVSLKTLQSLQSESELAFVLAHELGHLYYCHSTPELAGFLLSDFQKSIIEETHKRWEIEADSFAIATLKQSNYSAEDAVNLLERLEVKSAKSEELIHHHPSIKERTALIRKDLFILAKNAE